MNSKSKPHSLTFYAEALAVAVRRHAEILERHVDPPDAIAAANSVRYAAKEYVQHVLAETGWGNVFADLDADGDLEGSPESGESNVLSDEDAPVVIYRHQYELRVLDFDRARQLLESRAQLQDAAHCGDYDLSYTGVVAGLADVDGWQPSTYDQEVIEILSDKWESVLAGE